MGDDSGVVADSLFRACEGIQNPVIKAVQDKMKQLQSLIQEFIFNVFLPISRE